MTVSILMSIVWPIVLFGGVWLYLSHRMR